MLITGFKKGPKPSRDRWIATYTDPHLHTVDHYDMRYEAVQFYKCDQPTSCVERDLIETTSARFL